MTDSAVAQEGGTRVDHGSGLFPGRVVLDLIICIFSYLTSKEPLLLLIQSLLPQGGIGKRHSATSRLPY